MKLCLFLPVKPMFAPDGMVFMIGHPVVPVMGGDPIDENEHPWCSSGKDDLEAASSILEHFVPGIGAAIDYKRTLLFRPVNIMAILERSYMEVHPTIDLRERAKAVNRTRLMIGERVAAFQWGGSRQELIS